jgi:hypothetical protein
VARAGDYVGVHYCILHESLIRTYKFEHVYIGVHWIYKCVEIVFEIA